MEENIEQIEKEEIKTKFNSPIPFFIRYKKFIYGSIKPNLTFQISFYFFKTIAYTFLIWHSMSYLTILFRNKIYSVKKVDVEEMIFQRGMELDLQPIVFLDNLLDHHLLSILSWAIVHFGCVLFWRKKKFGLYINLLCITSYILGVFYFLGFRYYEEDISYFDKITCLIFIIVNFLLLIFFPRTKKEIISDNVTQEN